MPAPNTLQASTLALLDDASALLNAEAGLSSEGLVHELRKRVKALRAALRVARPSMSKKSFQRQDRRLRDVARSLSGTRDAHVIQLTLSDVSQAMTELSVAEALGSLGEGEVTQASSEALAAVAEALWAVREDVQRWKLRGEGFEALERGLVQLYEAGRDGLWFARNHPHAEALHEWRKEVKYLRYGLRPLLGVWPQVAGAMEAEWDRLGELLGKEHDLFVLQGRVEAGLEGLGPQERDALLSEILKRRAGLRDTALSLGERLYAERPRAFGRRWRGWWRAWARSPECAP